MFANIQKTSTGNILRNEYIIIYIHCKTRARGGRSRVARGRHIIYKIPTTYTTTRKVLYTLVECKTLMIAYILYYIIL